MKEFLNITTDEERALYGISDALVKKCVFAGEADGESALKETSSLTVDGCEFRLRYPMWHMSKSEVSGCLLTDTCRAALWYDRNVVIKDSELSGTKALRECDDTSIENCKIVSAEFGWFCRTLKIANTSLTSEYPFLQSRDMTFDGFNLTGKYSFQYAENVVIRNSVLNTKDAFWHGKNVTVYDSEVNGEYLGWYSENLRLVRCKIKGTQPLCYCKGLVLEDCEMVDADLSFENSEVNAEIRGEVLSVKNPKSGKIRAAGYGEIVLDAPTECEISTI